MKNLKFMVARKALKLKGEYCLNSSNISVDEVDQFCKKFGYNFHIDFDGIKLIYVLY